MAAERKTMNFHRNKRSRTPVEINLIPMIDVVLVLLIFFIVTTTFTRETGIDINLPEANGEPTTAVDSKIITLLIDKRGNYFISTSADTEGKKLDPDTLKQDLAQIMGNAPQTPFVITADGQTPHQAVIKALDIASQVGFKHIAFATKEPEI
jgi:biopolymer transport protein ExbD